LDMDKNLRKCFMGQKFNQDEGDDSQYSFDWLELIWV
jgi:hypothetical protein